VKATKRDKITRAGVGLAAVAPTFSGPGKSGDVEQRMAEVDRQATMIADLFRTEDRASAAFLLRQAAEKLFPRREVGKGSAARSPVENEEHRTRKTARRR